MELAKLLKTEKGRSQLDNMVKVEMGQLSSDVIKKCIPGNIELF